MVRHDATTKETHY
jgi:hypothetical protein